LCKSGKLCKSCLFLFLTAGGSHVSAATTQTIPLASKLRQNARIRGDHDAQTTAPLFDFDCSAGSEHLASSIRPAILVRINDNHDDYHHKPNHTHSEIPRKEAGDRAETAITRGH